MVREILILAFFFLRTNNVKGFLECCWNLPLNVCSVVDETAQRLDANMEFV